MINLCNRNIDTNYVLDMSYWSQHIICKLVATLPYQVGIKQTV